jgi:hypothetical protein
MTDNDKVATWSLDELLKRAQPSTGSEFVYANHARLIATTNEFIVDVFFAGPDPTNLQEPTVLHVQRVVIPANMAKGFTTGLANSIAGFEEATGVTLPNTRTKETTDQITIWS